MQELIKITTNEKGTKVVSAKELYEFLGFVTMTNGNKTKYYN